MLAINNLSFYFGDRPLYYEANLHIKPKDRIGLIGANGTGKSTLLRLIVGEYKADSGEISKSKDCTIGFLNQDLLSYQTTNSILDVALEAFEEQNDIQNKINDLLKIIETDPSEQNINKLSNLQERFDVLGGYTIQAQAGEILEGLGFSTADLERPLQEFSGGWRMRVMLAKLLLQKPSLLLLDEPTNHLDLPSIQWIENYLRGYEGAVIVVSHDRVFINNMANTIVEVSMAKLIAYAGNYDFYEKEKAIRQELQQSAYENQQAKIKQTEKFIERFRSKASKARQVQSRVKSLERMDMIEEVQNDNAVVNFSFNFGQKSGKVVIELEDISKSYGDREIFEHANVEIERGDKIALIGANGKGKSTLLRIVAGTENVEGERKMGYNVNASFFAQHQLEALNVENTILAELEQAGSGKSETEIRNILGCFLFTSDDVFKKIKVLSGGEKSRVAMAKVLVSEANFLLLDEPTNHLDMQSVNILAQALNQYEGSYLCVSHDRHFIEKVANKIWYIENKEIKVYPGNFEEYKFWRSQQEEKTQESTPKKSKKKEKKQKTPSEKQQLDKSLQKLNKELSQIENEVGKLEQKKLRLEEEMAKEAVYTDPKKMATKQEEYNQTDKSIEDKQEAWEKIALKIEELEAS